MRVLVTGATGFVAAHLLPCLGQAHEVVAVGHVAERIPQGEWDALEVDLRRVREISLPDVDAVVHLAQANAPFPDGAEDLFAVNTSATVALLEHARRCRAQAFVFASSASVYGFGDRPWRESDPLAATDFYSATKIAAERFVTAYAGSFSTTIMRLVAPYGPGQRNRLIPRLIDSVRDGAEITLNAGSRPRMNPIYVDDVVRVIGSLLDGPGAGVVNVAGEQAVTIRELAEAIGRVVSRKPVFVEGSGTAAGDIVCEIARLRERFAETLVPLDEGLRRTADATAAV